MKLLVGLLLVSMLLLAGCPGEEQAPAGPGTSGETAPKPPAQTGGEVEGGEGTAGAPDEPASMFDTWDMQAMMALGQPVHCTVDYVEGDYIGQSEMWFKGENMRVETTSEGQTTVVIMKGKVMYTAGGMAAMTSQENCDWVKMDSERLEECIPASEEATAAEMGAYDYEETYEATPAEYNCDYATFGDEKFDTPGKVCDITEEFCTLYESLGGGSGIPPMTPEDLCGHLEGEAYAECIAGLGLE